MDLVSSTARSVEALLDLNTKHLLTAYIPVQLNLEIRFPNFDIRFPDRYNLSILEWVAIQRIALARANSST